MSLPSTVSVSEFPAGGHGSGDLECDRCDAPATRGVGADGLTLCDKCLDDLKRWVSHGR